MHSHAMIRKIANTSYSHVHALLNVILLYFVFENQRDNVIQDNMHETGTTRRFKAK